jgi:spore maturation protein CgeB
MNVVHYEPRETILEEILDSTWTSDILIKASSSDGPDPLDQLILEARHPGQNLVFWDMHVPSTIRRLQQDLHDPLRALIPRFDAILTYGGGHSIVHAYEEIGAQLCIPIYNALDPEKNFPVMGDPRFVSDLSFLGTRFPDREQEIDEFLLTAARLSSQKTFLLGGSGWSGKALPANVRCIGEVGDTDQNAFNSSALAILNLAGESASGLGYAPSNRIFQAAGAAAAIISDYWPGIEEFFEPGKEILVAGKGEEVAAYIKALTPQAARKIGLAALKRALLQHTYYQRATQFENIVREGVAA